ncbi:hypothetical protein [Chryseobacterium turcicum]|uniref:Uncharacterized protein n=1 Tax=Chryseobacterium turcicum TaxID=2898076 RepID=A0A9Q3V6F1_9FLAO|nr:hypothetical protein [Chryseobacterium turcicum]MCD1119131.1 hypothetical protein [Chryseobacterium turcicum]
MAKNIGILASISWNSNSWQDQATPSDIAKSNFDYVKANGWMHEDLNFGHRKYPLEENGTYIAYTPQFNTLPSLEESKYVGIVFLKSFNYHKNKNFIVGCYAFPDIGRFVRSADEEKYNVYDFGNIRATPENIILFSTPMPITDEICSIKGYLPKGKKLGKMGYNYLEYSNVLKILDEATRLNRDKNLDSIKYKFLTDGRYKF